MAALRASLLSTLGRASASAPSTPPGLPSGSPKTGKSSKGKTPAAAAPTGVEAAPHNDLSTGSAAGGSPGGSPLNRLARNSPRPSLPASSAAPKPVARESLKLTGIEESRRSVQVLATRGTPQTGGATALSRGGMRIELSPGDLLACNCLPGELAAVYVNLDRDATSQVVAPLLVGPAWPTRALSDGQLVVRSVSLPEALDMQAGELGSHHSSGRHVIISEGLPVAVRRVQLAPASAVHRAGSAAAVWEADLVAFSASESCTAANAHSAAATGAPTFLDVEPWRGVVAWLAGIGALEGMAVAETTSVPVGSAPVRAAAGAAGADAAAAIGRASEPAEAPRRIGAVGSSALMWSLSTLLRLAEVAATSRLKADVLCPPVAALHASLAYWSTGKATAGEKAADINTLWLRLRPQANAALAYSCADADVAPGGAVSRLHVMSRDVRIVASAATEPSHAADGAAALMLPRTVAPRVANQFSSAAVSQADLAVDEGLRQLLVLVKSSLLAPQAYTAYGLSPPRGALLVGPPGTGKTLLATRVAEALSLPLLTLNAAGLHSPVIGETESRLRAAFATARSRAPCILFCDELDALAPRRGGGAGAGASSSGGASESDARIVAALLACMDGLAAKVGADAPGTPADSDHATTSAATAGSSAEYGAFKGSASAASGSTAQHLSATASVFILAATNRAAAIDPALRRPGRLDVEIAVPAPSEAGRRRILATCLSRYACEPGLLEAEADRAASADGVARADGAAASAGANAVTESAVLRDIASRTHGFVGADLDALAREAAAAAVRRACMATPGAFAAGSADAGPRISAGDVFAALRRVQPSALREVAVEVPNVKWTDIAGQADVKRRLLEAVEWPLMHAAAFTRMGIRPPRGVLLYGPPGCSKTLMAKAMASESAMNFISVKGPELLSCYVGDSERAVAEVFARARAVAPCVVFFDEVDALAGRRDAEGGAGGGGPSVGTRVVAQLLAELDGVSALQQVVVVAATNRPDLIDPALLRPGRVDASLYVGPPDDEAIADLVNKQLARVPNALTRGESAVVGDGGEVARVCAALRGYSGAEIVGIFRDAAVRAVSEAMHANSLSAGAASAPAASSGDSSAAAPPEVTGGSAAAPCMRMQHIEAAIAATPKQITADMLAFYAAFAARGGR